ncbi:hypothetical protein [Halarsenatibacter silvermanii]|uniref:Glycine cleavage system P-protein n=1 Tax=Halarsenatibacter silvermanii TaxID=321763 RepID=A0A1G9ISM1_9FIRM|nr:hypothetical protein [Halarsenatibacter silvermanii]SDL28288.1 Glycine cleavage system P-protein [Halarsenatibacter silvermanii]
MMTFLEKKISEDVSAVYIENPNYLGTIETKVADISRLAKSVGAEFVVGADPTSLGVLEAPGNYGATIVCGDLQPLGLHMKWGGALSGYIASIDEEKYVAEYPDLLFGITTTQEEGEYGFGHVAFDRTSYAEREEGKEFIGTTTALYGIVAGVYLALMGPEGMKELGEGIMQRIKYAQSLLSDIEGIEIASETACFKEFVVKYTDTDMSVKEINEALKEEGIFGGRDLSEEFEEMGNAALFSITEVHQKEDIQELALALEKVLN